MMREERDSIRYLTLAACLKSRNAGFTPSRAIGKYLFIRPLWPDIFLFIILSTNRESSRQSVRNDQVTIYFTIFGPPRHFLIYYREFSEVLFKRVGNTLMEGSLSLVCNIVLFNFILRTICLLIWGVPPTSQYNDGAFPRGSLYCF
jgi:hypothetical protein